MKKNHRGFTLLEVLIALIILAVALTGAILAVQTSIRGTSHIYDKLAAHWVAMNVLSSMQVGLLTAPTDSPVTGENRLLNRNFTWTAGIDQKNNGYYVRIYIDVSLAESHTSLEHLVGFLPVVTKKSALP